MFCTPQQRAHSRAARCGHRRVARRTLHRASCGPRRRTFAGIGPPEPRAGLAPMRAPVRMSPYTSPHGPHSRVVPRVLSWAWQLPSERHRSSSPFEPAWAEPELSRGHERQEPRWRHLPRPMRSRTRHQAPHPRRRGTNGAPTARRSRHRRHTLRRALGHRELATSGDSWDTLSPCPVGSLSIRSRRQVAPGSSHEIGGRMTALAMRHPDPRGKLGTCPLVYDRNE